MEMQEKTLLRCFLEFTSDLLRWGVGLALLVGPLLVLSAPQARAHDARITVGCDEPGCDGNRVSVQTSSQPSDRRFEFELSGQRALGIEHDPRVDGFELMVRGVGENGDRTELIRFDSTRWSVAGDGAEANYTYHDESGSRGGVTSATLSPGSFRVDASGANWTWDVAGPQEEVWVHFKLEEEWYCAKFSDETLATELSNVAGSYVASGAVAPGACPEQLCGNGVHELGEDCDDGNLVEDDLCNSACEAVECASVEYGSTFEAIQSKIFDAYSCNTAGCHTRFGPGGPDAPIVAPAGGLDLSADAAYDALVEVPSHNFANKDLLVLPGESKASFLYKKMMAAANGLSLESEEGGVMPPGPPVAEPLLRALDLWIRGGAPSPYSSSRVVDETAELLSACLPDPTPLKLIPPDPPTLGTGVQFRQPAWPLPAHFEDEICMATYYDLTKTNLVPPEYQVPCEGLFGPGNYTDTCFVYDREILRQDGQSHHSIGHLYTGDYPVEFTDPLGAGREFGPFTYKTWQRGGFFGYPPGTLACDPKDVSSETGSNKDCAGQIKSAVACNGNQAPGFFGGGYGPLDFNTGGTAGGGGPTAPAVFGSQESYYEVDLPAGVFRIFPMASVIIWNSHAFNLTNYGSTMEQYLDLYFAEESDRIFFSQGIFDAHDIFAQHTPPFQTEKICASYTIPKHANLTRLNSHTHQWGVEFTIYGPPNHLCRVDGNSTSPDGNCGPPNPDDETEQLIYVSNEYTDPINVYFNPPQYYGDISREDRTFVYCSVYDNGSKAGSPHVKRASTSPEAPSGFGPFVPGGPCPNARRNSVVYCGEGPKKGEQCGYQDGNDGAIVLDHDFCREDHHDDDLVTTQPTSLDDPLTATLTLTDVNAGEILGATVSSGGTITLSADATLINLEADPIRLSGEGGAIRVRDDGGAIAVGTPRGGEEGAISIIEAPTVVTVEEGGDHHDEQPDHPVEDGHHHEDVLACDYCEVRGGVTTEDEMFILLGDFFIAADDDLDGAPNELERRCGSDPASDTSTPADNDADRACDLLDKDDDNDGTEDTADDFPMDATETVDTDGDGKGNNADKDDDNDNLMDAFEAMIGTSALLADTDGDGQDDLMEFFWGSDPTDSQSRAALGSEAVQDDLILYAWGVDVPGAPTGSEFTAIAPGSGYSLALKADGSIAAWGDDTSGQVSNAPIGTGFTAIAAGGGYGLALAADGSITAWGDDTSGQVSNAPIGTGFTAIAAGSGHSLALAADGSIVSWGFSNFGLVSDTPTGTGFTAIAAGFLHSLALTADGSIEAWGYDQANQGNIFKPVGSGFTAIAGGELYSMALSADGSIVSWGNTSSDQHNDTPTGSGFTAIAAGASHSLALSAAGSIVAWGNDDSDQVSGTPAGTGFTVIAASSGQSLAVPEPAAALLASFALLTLAGLRRARRH